MLKKKRVLGRGLGALIGESSGAGTSGDEPRGDEGRAEEASSAYFHCPVGDISPGSTQPRKHFEEGPLKELADSIREKGVIEPLLVRRAKEGGYELIAGERRLRAAKLAGLEKVPVVTTDATDEESLELAIIENIQRQDLNAIEEAEAYRSLADYGLSQEEVAARVGKERATVANYMRLLKLPPEVKDEIARGNLSMGHARAILSAEGHSNQTSLMKKVLKKGLSVRETEALANGSSSGGTRKKKPGPSAQDPALAPIEDELRDIFGTKVSLRESRGRGKIEFSYYSGVERERLLEIFRQLID